MSRAWVNNPNGVCEDAPCCGCCGPQGDGAFDPEDRFYEDLDAEASFYEDGPEFDDDEEECPNCGGPDGYPSGHAVGCPARAGFTFEPGPDPGWMNP